MFSDIAEIIKLLGVLPVRLWKGGCTDGSTPQSTYFGKTCDSGFYVEPNIGLSLITGFIFYLIPILFATLTTLVIGGYIKAFLAKENCRHCMRLTDHFSSGLFDNCPEGAPCCKNCHENHLDSALEQRALYGSPVRCPNCDETMTMMVVDRRLIHVCKCGSEFKNAADAVFIDRLNGQSTAESHS